MSLWVTYQEPFDWQKRLYQSSSKPTILVILSLLCVRECLRKFKLCYQFMSLACQLLVVLLPAIAVLEILRRLFVSVKIILRFGDETNLIVAKICA